METPDAGQNIITRGLPKTGQVTQYRAGDDGQHEAGWWKGRLNANNRERWIAKTIVGEDIVVDRATGLMWAADHAQAGCFFYLPTNWNVAIDYANTLVFANFNDWRIPNVFELASILRFRGVAPFIEQPPFSNTVSDWFWTSTTYPIVVTRAHMIRFSDCTISRDEKTENHYIRCVRGGL